MDTKGLTFGKNDKELIENIIIYQHKNQLPSFIAAVRKLCKIALEIEKIHEKEK